MLINLKVKTLDAQTHEFTEINNEITVRDFKDQIAEKTGIAPDQQRIIYCGRVLVDEKHLKDYDVDGKVLHVAERPPPSQRGSSSATGSTSNDNPRSERSNRHNMRNSPLFRALDGMMFGTMAIPMNGGPNMNGPTALHPLTASSSFCMNRITVARHMLNCVNNIAAYLEDPSRGLNNVPLDILARGRWTMESTVVEVGITATDLPQSQNIVEMVQGAVSAALRRNGNTNVTVVQLPTMFDSNDGDGSAGATAAAIADLSTPSTAESSDNHHVFSLGGSTESEGGGGGGGGNVSNLIDTATVIIDDILQDIEDTATNASSNVAQMGSTASSESGSSQHSSNSTSTTDGGIGSTSVGTNTDDNIQSRRTRTNVLAEVFEQMRTVWTRMSPFIEQTQEMLQNEPTFDENDTTARENAQRLFDRVSEAFHYMSHAQHAISDLMLDFGQSTPRYLTCRPILVEQSGYVSSNNYISAAAAAAAANAFRQPQNSIPTQQQQQQQQQQSANVSSNSMTQTDTSTSEAAAAAASGSAPVSAPATAAANTVCNTDSTTSSNTNNIVEDPIDEPISASGPNRVNGSTTTTNNAGTQSTDNHQMQMARLIQAVVNSAPVDTEFHVQINSPSIVSFGVPMNASGLRTQRRNGTSQTTATTTATTNNTNNSNNTAAITNDGSGSSTTSGEASSASASPSSSATAISTSATSTPSASVSASTSSTSLPSSTLGNQIRVNTATLPTTSTQTRSTSRPQVQIGTLPGVNLGGVGGRLMAPQFSAFDRFLPCNSHHIRDILENAANNGENGNNLSGTGNNGARNSGIVHNQAHASNRGSTARILTDLIGRPSLTVGSTMSAPRASAAPYTRRPANVANSIATPATGAAAVSLSPPLNVIGTGASNFSSAMDDSNDSTSSLTGSLWDREMTTSTGFGNSLRLQLNEFLSQTLFEGHPINELHMERARNRALSWFSDHLFYLRQYEKPEYDSQDSVLNILRKMWPLIIEALTDGQTNAEQYEVRIKKMCEQFVTRLYSVLIVCIGRENADMFWGQLMRHLVGPIKMRFRTEARQLLLCFVTTSIPTKIDTTDAGQFITYRRMDDDDDDNGGENVGVNASVGIGGGDNDNNKFKPEVDGQTIKPTIATEAANELQQIDTEMLELDANSSIEQQNDLSADTARFTDATSTLAQVLPIVDLPHVTPGTEAWHNTVPTTWLPLLTRDVQFQAQHPPTQSPFSDGYISGMSAKRRKMIQNSKQPTTDLRSLMANSVREAIQNVTTANPLPSSSTIDAHLSNDDIDAQEVAIAAAVVEEANVQVACKDVARTNIRERLKTDKDFESERFPKASKFADL